MTFPGAAVAPGWQVMWDYTTRDDGTSPTAQLSPAFLTTFSTGLPPFSGAPYAPLRNSIMAGADLFRAAGSFGAAATAATQASLGECLEGLHGRPCIASTHGCCRAITERYGSCCAGAYALTSSWCTAACVIPS